VSLRGVGFFDLPRKRIGGAPNGMSIHPVTRACFGAGCWKGWNRR